MSSSTEQLLGGGPVLPLSAPSVSMATRWSIGAIGLLAIVMCAVLVSQWAKDPIRSPVNNVDILGTVDYEDRAELVGVVQKYTGDGFYSLDIDNVRRSVENLPWVAHARVSRVWPSRIQVQVEEHEPAARWNDDSLISKRLKLFVPPQLQLSNPRYVEWHEMFSTLPQITGADGRHSELLDAFRDYESRLLPYGVTLDALHEDKRGSLTMELSNQVTVKLGYEQRDLRLSRFLDVFNRLVGSQAADATEGAGPTTFDMRYSNGFALGGYGRSGVAKQLNGQSTLVVPRATQ